MPDQHPPPCRIRFRFSCDDADLLRLALGVLNVYAARQLAGRYGLPLDETPAGEGAREFVLLAPARRLEDVILGLRQDSVAFGPVDCPDRAALELCHGLGAPARLLGADEGPVP